MEKQSEVVLKFLSEVKNKWYLKHHAKNLTDEILEAWLKNHDYPVQYVENTYPFNMTNPKAVNMPEDKQIEEHDKYCSYLGMFQIGWIAKP